MSRIGSLLLTVLLLGGCVTHEIRVVTMITFEQKQTTLSLGNIVFDPPHTYSGDQQEVRKLCQGIARQYGFTILNEDSTAPIINFYLRDRAYTKEFSNLHSIAGFSEITDPSGRVLYKTYYLKDSSDSLQSLGFITEIFEQTFQSLWAEMEALEKARKLR